MPEDAPANAVAAGRQAAELDPEDLVASPGEEKPLHNLKVPNLRPSQGSVVAPTKNVEVLTALDNWANFARVPRKKTVQAGLLLSLAMRLESQDLFTNVLNILQMHTAEDGYRSEQAKDVLIAEKQAHARAEAWSKLARMGPQPQENEATNGA